MAGRMLSKLAFRDSSPDSSFRSPTRPLYCCRLPTELLLEGPIEDVSAFSASFCSALSLSCHQTAPAASHAWVRTECIICPVSKPSSAMESRSCFSSAVEKAGTAADDSKAKKSGSEGCSRCGRALSDMVLPMDRRLVREGVRECAAMGRAGEPCGRLSSMAGLGGGKR